jgi:hypothetical protein
VERKEGFFPFRILRNAYGYLKVTVHRNEVLLKVVPIRGSFSREVTLILQYRTVQWTTQDDEGQ